MAAATSSIKLSFANVFCKRLGDRKGPVKKGDAIEWLSTRSLLTVPVPPQAVPTQPEPYGEAELPLLLKVVGGAAAAGTSGGVGNPARAPVTMLPGVAAAGRFPLVRLQISESHARIVPLSSTPARRSTIVAGP